MSHDTTTSTEGSTNLRKPPKKAGGRVTIIRERCKGCGYCVEFCPTDVLEMSPEFNAKGYHYPQISDGRDCSGCDLCGMYCPDFAISGTHRATEKSKQETHKE